MPACARDPIFRRMDPKDKRIGKDSMFSHACIKRDFDVDEWARPEFLEQGVWEWLEEEREQMSSSNLAEGGGLEVEGTRLG